MRGSCAMFVTRLLFICCSLSLISCWSLVKQPPIEEIPVRAQAYVPVYDSSDMKLISSDVARPIVSAGKIYVLGNYLFQVEKLEGVHVINYTDRNNPVKVGFIKSRGCSEIAAKGGYLILNNMADLVTVDISNTTSVREVARIKNAFPQFHAEYADHPQLPDRGVYYVCPQFDKGKVKSWKLEKDVEGAFCYY
jgi:hypothetical protein